MNNWYYRYYSVMFISLPKTMASSLTMFLHLRPSFTSPSIVSCWSLAKHTLLAQSIISVPISSKQLLQRNRQMSTGGNCFRLMTGYIGVADTHVHTINIAIMFIVNSQLQHLMYMRFSFSTVLLPCNALIFCSVKIADSC